MRVLVTGGAGFIGSHLAEALVARGDDVRVVDCLTPYYDLEQKQANLHALDGRAEVLTTDLGDGDLAPLVADIDVVFHQAGQPGVRLSWGDGFAAYEFNNIRATQRLLEACRDAPLRRFVYASSSSIYGDAERYPTAELDLPRPRSPYGVTKLAGEHLCSLYAATWQVPTVSLRYFTVYGPRQRPDMAFHRLCDSVLTGQPFPQYGDGSQIRDFTFVTDVVAANLAAAEASTAAVAPGEVVNVAGGTSTSLADVIATVEELAGQPVPIDHRPEQSGDVSRTGASTDRARSWLGWRPEVDLRAGLAQQLAWHRERQPTAPDRALDQR
jgi:nucleoside-diphosphate-sugar epimerase